MFTVEERWRLIVPYEPKSPWRVHAIVAAAFGVLAVGAFGAHTLFDGAVAAGLGIASIVFLVIAGTAAASGAVRTILFRNQLRGPERPAIDRTTTEEPGDFISRDDAVDVSTAETSDRV